MAGSAVVPLDGEGGGSLRGFARSMLYWEFSEIDAGRTSWTVPDQPKFAFIPHRGGSSETELIIGREPAQGRCVFNRRTFLRRSLASIAALSSAGGAHARVSRSELSRRSGIQQGPTASVKTAARRDETLLRLGGVADNFHMTWGKDDQQFVTANDGWGWFPEPKDYYNSRLFSITGSPSSAKFHDVEGYPRLVRGRGDPKYYSLGTLALDGRIYQFLSTWNHAGRRPDGSAPPDFRFIGAKLIYSTNNGRTWCNQDGSTPVIWEEWDNRSRNTLVFFEEDDNAFSLFSVLQMGRNYEQNRDGYVYVYSPNGATEGTMNELVMFRAPKAEMLNRKAYEYFAGFQSSGEARWSSGMGDRKPVHRFPRGWVNRGRHPWAWLPSVAYNQPLNLYMMVNWATGPGPEPDRLWFQKPSYLGLWVAENPWGPWRQIHEEQAWLPGGETGARCYSASIAPKWIAADGKSFWLVWSDFQTSQSKQEQAELLRRPTAGPEDERRIFAEFARNHPNYQFNTQRVDLIIA
jgi:hypothetical protein